MTKEEFLEKAKINHVSEKDWDIINFVYTFHPSIDNVKGKEQIVTLYNEFGMVVIKGMVEVAEYAKKLDIEECQLMKQLKTIKDRKKDLADGKLDLEYCISEVSREFERASCITEFEDLVKPLENKYGATLIVKARKILNI